MPILSRVCIFFQLLVRQEHMDKGGLVLHVSAPPARLFEIAETMDLKLMDTEGIIKPFVQSQLASFPSSGYVGPLTWSDAQKCGK